MSSLESSKEKERESTSGDWSSWSVTFFASTLITLVFSQFPSHPLQLHRVINQRCFQLVKQQHTEFDGAS